MEGKLCGGATICPPAVGRLGAWSQCKQIARGNHIFFVCCELAVNDLIEGLHVHTSVIVYILEKKMYYKISLSCSPDNCFLSRKEREKHFV